MPPLRYAILGTGALGGYYGGLLARAGNDVRFLLRSDFSHVQTQGLRIDSARGDFRLPAARVNAYRGVTDLPACDVALLCVKTTQTAPLVEQLPDFLKPGGVAVVLQNGLNPEAAAARTLGTERVLGGLCFLCSNKVGPGHIRHLDYGHIHLGAYDPSSTASPATDLLPRIAEDFAAAEIQTLVVDDLRLARWKKLAWNIPYNGLSVVWNRTTDALMADPASRREVEALMSEVQAAAKAVDGRVIEDAFVEKMLDYTEKMRPYKTSMMLDHEAGQPMEIESIVGDPLRAAQAVHCDVPAMHRLYQRLTAIASQPRVHAPGPASGPPRGPR
jgi:2-dehydropantoate 2-reductase